MKTTPPASPAESVADAAGTTSSKKATKQRGPVRRALVRTMKWGGCGLLLLAVVYGALYARFVTRTHTITHNYYLELDRANLEVPEEKRAWPIIARAQPLVNMGADRRSPIRMHTLVNLRPGDSDWPTLQSVLADHRAEIEALHTVVDYERLGFAWTRDSEPDDPARVSSLTTSISELERAYSIQYPYSSLRRTILCLLADARVGCFEREAARASRSLRATLRIIKLHPTWETLLGHLVKNFQARSILIESVELIWPLRELFTDEELRGISAELEGLVPEYLDLTGEALVARAGAQVMFSDDGAGNGSLTQDGWFSFTNSTLTKSISGHEFCSDCLLQEFLAPFVTAFGISRKEYIDLNDRFYSELSEFSKRGLWELGPGGLPPTTVDRLASNPLQRYRAFIVADTRTIYASLVAMHQYALMHLDVARTVVALERSRRATGNWPASLDELIPEFLPALPLDRFVGKPLGYVVRDGEPVLYGAGADLDDDGGRAPTGTPEGYKPTFGRWHQSIEGFGGLDSYITHPPDGDWVFLPVAP